MASEIGGHLTNFDLMSGMYDTIKGGQDTLKASQSVETPMRVKHVVEHLTQRAQSCRDPEMRANLLGRAADIKEKAINSETQKSGRETMLTAVKATTAVVVGVLGTPISGAVVNGILGYAADHYADQKDNTGGIIRPARKVGGRRLSSRGKTSEKEGASVKSSLLGTAVDITQSIALEALSLSDTIATVADWTLGIGRRYLEG